MDPDKLHENAPAEAEPLSPFSSPFTPPPIIPEESELPPVVPEPAPKPRPTAPPTEIQTAHIEKMRKATESFIDMGRQLARDEDAANAAAGKALEALEIVQASILDNPS